jgi:tRNA dimethylallyltransferase
MTPVGTLPVLIAGPTAVGKSAIALALAEAMGGEIISVDSMQVYRAMDIGTAKPCLEDQRRVRHHLIDVLDISEHCDAAAYLHHAAHALAEVRKRGLVPVFCGGTGFYLKALLEGLPSLPPSNPALHRELEASPLDTLLAELRERDPETFARIDRRNPRRVVRALEVLRLTGQSISPPHLTPQGQPRGLIPAACPFFCFARSSADLRKRIDARVDLMFEAGLLEETATLMKRGLADNQVALQALGYRQVVEHLAGHRSLPETIALVKTRTWQYARRQMTWFRRQARPTWIHLEPETKAEAAVSRILGELSRNSTNQS